MGTRSGLDSRRSIWIEQEELGQEKVIHINHQRHVVVMPCRVRQHALVRYRGLGKTKGGETGDLYLDVWLNKGEDIQANLWLSETCARRGADKRLLLDEDRCITVVVPPGCHDGQTVRLRGYGLLPDFSWHVPFLRRRAGNALVKLSVYPDTITPTYSPYEWLATEDMALEGWVYRKIGEVIGKLGEGAFPAAPLGADAIADVFNEFGWEGIFPLLRNRMRLNKVNVEVRKSKSMENPGTCQKSVTTRNNVAVGMSYTVTIHERFTDNPFIVAAILAHELCHVVYGERLDPNGQIVGVVLKSKEAQLEEERTVDLLSFMFKVGEFQLRTARQNGISFGYFNQRIFERMQVIVAKKLGST